MAVGADRLRTQALPGRPAEARAGRDNTIHGFLQGLRAFANQALLEGYPVDPVFLRVRAPMVAQKEMATYSPEQLLAIVRAVPSGWARAAVAVLLGTGMRFLRALRAPARRLRGRRKYSFLKIRRGKGAKFRRVPITHRLRRELTRYVNPERPESRSANLLILPDGRPSAS